LWRLYEELGVFEYWELNVADVELVAFQIDNRWSGGVQVSKVLPGLALSTVEEALKQS